MRAIESVAEVSAKVCKPFSIGQPVRLCQGTLAGVSGTLTELPKPGRSVIRLQQGVYLEIDQSHVEPKNVE